MFWLCPQLFQLLMSEFYEWQALPFGKKQPHAFRHPDEQQWLWVAGLREPSERHGPATRP